MGRKNTGSRKSLNPNSLIKRCGQHLPEELLTEILTRLPSKSLIRFRCVCKPWNSLIASPTFIAAHCDLSHNNNKPLLFIHSYYKKDMNLIHSFSLHSDCNGSLKLYSHLRLPFQIKEGRSHPHSQYVSIIGSCNGIVCLFHAPGFLLWNPSIRKVIRLPDPTLRCCPFRIPIQDFVGFCFDSRSNDYKVVRVVDIDQKSPGIYQVEIYSLNAGSWRTIDPGLPCEVHLGFVPSSRAFMNGALHWPAYNISKTWTPCILSFDLTEELCKKIALPERLEKVERDKMLISAYENKYLAVIQYNVNLNLHVWVMKEYGVVESWIKLFSTDQINVSLAELRPLVFRKNGEILMERTTVERYDCYHPVDYRIYSKLMSFDPQRQLIRFEHFGQKESFEAESYVESLVQLNESKCTNFLAAEEE